MNTMNTATVILLAFAIGLVNGLRSFTAPAVVAWAARWKWLNLDGSFLAFMGSAVAAYIFTAGRSLNTLLISSRRLQAARRRLGSLLAPCSVVCQARRCAQLRTTQ